VIVLGVDPGTAVTGYGVVSGDGLVSSLIECGVIRTDARACLAERLAVIFDGISEVIGRHHPDRLAVENAFYSKNVRTTLVLGHARGVILLAGARAGLPVDEYAPAMIKKTVVGAGAATKSQVQFMTARLLRLKTHPSPSDAADGVAAALTSLMQGRARMDTRERVPAIPSRFPSTVAARMRK
jgi:crossover junction endodeoxyribonuclease RuvC